MIDLPVYLAFIGAVLILQTTPGPDMMLVISRGIGQGQKIAFFTAFGFTAAGLVQLPLLAFGIASVVQTSPLAYDLIRYLGGLYLIYLGLKLLFKKRDSGQIGSLQETGPFTAIYEGMITNLLNPKVLVFMLAFLPQFTDPKEGSIAVQLLILGVTMKCCGLLVNGIVATLSGGIGQRFSKSALFFKWQEGLAGTVMVGLGVNLVLEKK